MLQKTLLLMALSFSAGADDLPKNFCLNHETAQQNETLARQHPTDDALIKLVALRAGLCDLLNKQIIDLDFAIDLFNAEHAHGIQQRLKEEQTNTREKGA
ncbi:MAG: hypothetical protein PHG36_02675 [Dehalococcoidia bacterium]|nr:hypothetical protein [Dehalococcoidia bacterium]